MLLNEMQSQTDDWMQDNTTGYWDNGNMLAQMIEELGEVGRVINLMDTAYRKD